MFSRSLIHPARGGFVGFDFGVGAGVGAGGGVGDGVGLGVGAGVGAFVGRGFFVGFGFGVDPDCVVSEADGIFSTCSLKKIRE